MFELDRVRGRKLPPASIALGALTLVLYAIEVFRSGSTDPRVDQLLALGASEHHAIWTEHQLWRLLCPAFLHASVVHVVMNGYSFFQLAPFVERIWGSARFLVVYVVSAIAGAALSSRNPGVVSVGASGAIFGLVGFLLAAAYTGTHKHEVRAIVRGVWGQGLLISVGAIFIYGFTPSSHIDNMAHAGGLAAGFGLGMLLVETEEADAPMIAMGAASVLAIVAAWGAFFIDRSHEARYRETVVAAQSAYEKGDYALAARCCEQALVLRPHDELAPVLCELEGRAYLRASKLDEAGYALERAWRTEPSAEVALLLVEVHVRKKDSKQARSWAEQCKRSVTGRGSLELKAELERIGTLETDPETAAAIAAITSR